MRFYIPWGFNLIYFKVLVWDFLYFPFFLPEKNDLRKKEERRCNFLAFSTTNIWWSNLLPIETVHARNHSFWEPKKVQKHKVL